MDLGVPGITGAEQIGQGAFGKVYRAQQEELGRIVAVKVLANVDLDEEARVRFTREAKAIGRMSGHPNIVNVFAQGTTTEGMPYLIMEYCAKGSLADRLKAGRSLSWQEASEIMVAIAGALQTSHHAGILHRDIKPANILIDSYDTPKLADFGIARLGTDVSVTATGMLTGSPAHIAPELVAGDPPSQASDIYSLGSTLFTLITGRAPFHRDTDTSILSLLQRISAEPAPHLGQWGVPSPVADLVAATLSKDPARRPPTCHDFAQALMTARSAPRPPSPGLETPGRNTPGLDSLDLNATVLPATYPSGAFGPGLGSKPGTPRAAAPAGVTTDPGVNRQQTLLIVLCWVIVAICLVIIGWILVGRAQTEQATTAAALGAAYFLGR